MAKPRKATLPLGRAGEEIALAFLTKIKKFKVVERSFRLHRGEIDIIGWDRGTLVFVEVKTRTGDAFGRPEESVTPAKQKQVRKLAQGYLLMRRLGEVNCRFDVISVRIGSGIRPKIDHFPDAF